MNQPKTTAEIRAEPDAFKAACARAATAFGRIPGVISVGFGLKESAGTFGEELAIVVFVTEKKPAEALPPAERIPPSFEGYRTDVRVVPYRRLGACEYPAVLRDSSGATGMAQIEHMIYGPYDPYGFA